MGVLAVGVGGRAGESYYAYHKVTSAIAPVAAPGSLDEIEGSVRKQGPYTPPASGERSRTQRSSGSWRGSGRSEPGSAPAEEFYRRYRRYVDPVDGAPSELHGAVDTAMSGLRMFLGLAGVFVEGKRAQVDALNRAGMSLEGCTHGNGSRHSGLGRPNQARVKGRSRRFLLTGSNPGSAITI